MGRVFFFLGFVRVTDEKMEWSVFINGVLELSWEERRGSVCERESGK